MQMEHKMYFRTFCQHFKFTLAAENIFLHCTVRPSTYLLVVDLIFLRNIFRPCIIFKSAFILKTFEWGNDGNDYKST